jgi:hypothetical protein
LPPPESSPTAGSATTAIAATAAVAAATSAIVNLLIAAPLVELRPQSTSAR